MRIGETVKVSWNAHAAMAVLGERGTVETIEERAQWLKPERMALVRFNPPLAISGGGPGLRGLWLPVADLETVEASEK